MEINCVFDHYNFNVTDLAKSMDFYEKALGLKEVRRIEPEDGSFIIVYLGDTAGNFRLELTWLRDWAGSYNLGDNEMHLCVRANQDYDEVRKYHREMGWICYENPKMGIYFINDPDNYWIEILPALK